MKQPAHQSFCRPGKVQIHIVLTIFSKDQISPEEHVSPSVNVNEFDRSCEGRVAFTLGWFGIHPLALSTAPSTSQLSQYLIPALEVCHSGKPHEHHQEQGWIPLLSCCRPNPVPVPCCSSGLRTRMREGIGRLFSLRAIITS